MKQIKILVEFKALKNKGLPRVRIHQLPSALATRAKASWRAKRFKSAVNAFRWHENYDRIYHYHVRKTGGTSINKMFHSLSGESPDVVYDQLTATNPRQIRVNKIVFAAWQQPLLEAGDYHYGFSHIPFTHLTLPERTFTFTCFRDPVKRVLSHYRMLLELQEAETPHSCLTNEAPWLGDSFADFLANVPDSHLLNQLYMFDEDLQIEQALQNVRSLDHWVFLEDFASGIASLNEKAGLQLVVMHTRRGAVKYSPSPAELETLRVRLQPEYEFLERLKSDPLSD